MHTTFSQLQLRVPRTTAIHETAPERRASRFLFFCFLFFYPTQTLDNPPTHEEKKKESVIIYGVVVYCAPGLGGLGGASRPVTWRGGCGEGERGELAYCVAASDILRFTAKKKKKKQQLGSRCILSKSASLRTEWKKTARLSLFYVTLVCRHDATHLTETLPTARVAELAMQAIVEFLCVA